jgi:5-methylcytosine-specific restriction endonuclease McrA
VKKKNEPENLITLCRKCHSKTKKDREYWKIYFQDLMKNKKGP